MLSNSKLMRLIPARQRARWRAHRRKLALFAGALILLVGPTVYLTLIRPDQTKAAPWASTATDWHKRKSLTLINNSGQTLIATTTYSITINTKELVDAGDLNSDCSDLRIYYQPDENTNTKLAYYFDPASGATDCSDSEATKLYFPLQANLSNNVTDTEYYLYYDNDSAVSEASVSAFDVGGKQATLVCPFNGDTTCVNSAGAETPSTATGAIRYSGAKSALSFDGVNDQSVGGTLANQDRFTVETWIYLTKFDDGAVYRTFFAAQSGMENLALRIYSNYGSNDKVELITRNVSYANVMQSDTLSLNTWYHVAAVFDGTNIYLYINGVQKGSNAKTNTAILGNISVGSQSGWRYFNGLIDEVRVSTNVRYTSNFTPQTTPFVRDEYTKLLLHFDENGDDPRNTGKAIDDSGNANHGTITGAKYVSGLVGVDASATDTGKAPSQSYASHEGVFIEEGTTNKITNPSFEHSTFDTNWATETNSFRDEFTTDESTPIASPRTAEPGPGTLTSTVTSPNTLSIASSKLNYTYTTGGSGPTISGSVGYQAGRTLFMSLQKTNDDHSGITLGSSLGWGIGFWGKNMVSSGMNQGNYAMGLPTMPYSTTTGPYRYAITMTDEGYLFWLHDNTRWRLAWFEEESISGTQNWSFYNAAQDGNIDNITISDLPTPFTDNDNITKINTPSPGTSYTASGVSNAVTYATVTAATGVDHELIVRRTDDSNKWVIRGLQASSLIKLIEVNAGIETERASAALTWTNGVNYKIAVIHDNTNANGIYVYVNDNNAIYYEGATFNATATGIATGSTGTYSSLKQFPRGTNNEYEFLSGEFVTSVSKNTSASYVKFGSSSAKLDNSTNALDGNYFTQVTATATTHTLSAYVYNGTSGAIGGTIDSSVARLTYSGGSISTSYTDTGGGWWRLTGSFTASATSQQYGVQVKAGKTIYLDGVQLEEKAYTTTYADGSLGTDYAWTGTANASNSTRTAVNLQYSPTNHLNGTSGTISYWLKFNSSETRGGWNEIIQSGSWVGSNAVSFFTSSNLGTLYFDYKPSSGNSGRVTGTFNPGIGWHHIVATWDYNNLVLYKDGVQIAIDTTVDNNASLTSNIRFENMEQGPTTSDFKIYDTALSSSEVSSLYYSGLGSHELQTDYTEQFSGQEGPVAFWKFDDGFGEIAYDSSNQGNNASISGPTWSEDEFGSAPDGKSLQFDGTNDYVAKTYNNDIELDPGTLPFTISTWFKAPSSVSTQQTLISRYSSSGYKLYMNASGQVCFGVDDDSSWGPDDTACSNDSFADSEWHFVTAVKDTDSINVYVDGMKMITTTLTATGGLSGSNTTFYVGIDSDGSSNPWKGFIDEVRVYTYALNTTQIMAEYAARGSVKGISAGFIGEGAEGALGQGLVGYWKMDEASWNGTAGEVLDSSGNSNNGTRVGDATTATGKFASGGTFDDAGDYVNIGSPTSLDNLAYSSFTTSAWIYQTGSGYNTVVSKDAGGGTTGWEFFATGGTTQSISFRINTDGGIITSTTANTTVPLNTWAHVTATYDNSGDRKLHIYINGIEQSYLSQGEVTGVVNDDNTYDLFIGELGNWDFGGKLDEVRIYNRALSPAEVQSLYNWAPGPILYSNFDEGTGNTVNDLSGNNHHGNWYGTGAHWSTGMFGKGGKFDGTSDYVDYGGSNLIHGKTQFTLKCAINTSVSNNTGQICGKISDDFQQGYGMFMELTKVKVWFGGSIGTPYSITSNKVINDGKWHDLAMVYDKSLAVNQLKLYIDGVLDNSATTSGDNIDETTGTYFTSGEIVLNGQAGDFKLSGSVDEIKLYDYARTPEQIVEDMNAGHPAPGSPVGSPIVHYKLDEGFGSTANNSISGGTNGTLRNSPIWSNNGVYEKSLLLNGTNQYVEVPDSSGLKYTGGDLTLSVWVYRDPAETDRNRIISKPWNGSGQYNYTLETYTDGSIVFVLDGSTYWYTSTTEVVPTNTWTHLVVTVSGSTKAVNIYKNGILFKSDAHNITNWTPSSGDENVPLALGTLYPYGEGSWSYPSHAFKGMIDEVKIYNLALSDDQVKTEYNMGKATVMGALSTDVSGETSNASDRSYCPPGDSTGSCAPVAEWKFDENTGTTANDTSGNNNHLTLTVPEWIPGKYGSALNFISNTNGAVNTSPSSVLESLTNHTYGAWVKITGSNTDNAAIIGRAVDNLTTKMLHLDSSQRPSCFVDYNGTNATAVATDALTQNIWHHVVCTHDGSTATTRLFIDGVEPVYFSHTTGTSGVVTPDSWYLVVGNSNNFNRKFPGELDSAIIYNYVRTPAQIAWDYNRGAPVAHYKMDECSGTTLHSSNETYNAALNGTWSGTGGGAQTAAGDCSTPSTAWGNGATGKLNASLNFDGTDDSVQSFLPSVERLPASSSTTVSMWVKANSIGSQRGLFVSSYGNHQRGRWGILIDSTGKVFSSVYASNVATYRGALSSTSINIGSWHHVMGIFDRESQQLRTYLDGKLVGTGQFLNSDVLEPSDAQPESIGANIASGANSSYFSGQIDDVQIFNYALTQDQIQTVYNNGAVLFTE